MIRVTDLATFLYCPRKLYLESTVEVLPLPKDVMIRGSIKHSVIDQVNRAEERIVNSVNSKTDVSLAYLRTYKEILSDTLIRRKKQIEVFNLDVNDLFVSSWAYLLKEGLSRASLVSSFISKNKVYGSELWEMMPKVISELRVKSKELRLKGIVDRIEVGESYVPVELKSGRVPLKGVWPGNKIQLTAYMMLLKEHFGKEVNFGYVRYIDHDESRRVVLNPFSVDEVVSVRDKIFEMDSEPPLVENKKKCLNCQFNDVCYKEDELGKLNI